MKFRRPRPDALELNLTPLIDCLLFLIIFFLLTTTFTKTGKLQIQLPQSTATVAAGKGKPVEIAIDAGGRYAVNGHVIASQQAVDLRDAVVAEVGARRDMPFIISADGKAPHQSVVTVMDVAGQLGFRNLGIGTRDAAPAH